MIPGRLCSVIFISFILSITLSIGCQGSTTPQEVAQNFWNAIKAHDTNTARKYSTVSTRDSIDISNELFQYSSLTFGMIIINGDKTIIESTIKTNKNGQKTIVPFLIILMQEEGVWRVDYEETKNTIKEDISLSEIIEDINELGKELSRNIYETLSKLKQKIPEVERRVKKYGETASKEINESFQQHLPEIRKSIEKMGKTLEKEVQEAWQQHIPEIKKDMEEFMKALEEALKIDDKNNKQ